MAIERASDRVPLITLTTDFGAADAYVGIMKGVMLDIAPRVRLVDLTHELPPQCIMAGALALEAATPHFADGAIHLAVVDPGVGSARRAIAVKINRATFVAPDNGLLSLVLPPAAQSDGLVVVELAHAAYHRQPVSATFHGRDIFAPVAAHLAAGVALDALGPRLDPATLVGLDLPRPTRNADGSLTCHVLHVDRFGNLITSLRREMFERLMPAAEPAALRLRIGDHETAGREIASLSRTFADVSEGQLVAYFGSSGRLEIAVRNGSAAAVLDVPMASKAAFQGSRRAAPSGSGGPDCVAVQLYTTE